MRFDGLTLVALAGEITAECGGQRVEKVSSAGPGAVFFSLQRGGILASASPNGARAAVATAKGAFRAEPTGFVMVLRKHLEGGRFVDARKRPSENAIVLNFRGWDDDEGNSAKSLVVECTGARSNMFFLDGAGMIIDSMKKAKDQRMGPRPDMPGEKYEPPPPFELPDALSCSREAFVAAAVRQRAARPASSLASAISRGLYGLSEQHVEDLLKITGYSGDDAAQGASAAFEALRRRQAECGDAGWACTIVGEGTSSARMSLILPGADAGRGPSGCVERLLGGMEARLLADARKAQIMKRLDSALAKAAGKLDARSEDLRSHERGDSYRVWADAILAGMHGLPERLPGKAVLKDYSTDPPQEIEVPLDQAKSAAKNAEGYYSMYNRSRRAVKALAGLVESSAREVEYLERVKDALERAEDPNVVSQIQEELECAGYLAARRKPAARGKKPGPALPAEYTLSSGHKALVGRNNAQNDLLTFSIASPWDLWFHVKGAPGSHVVLRRQKGEAVPDSALDEAMKLALANSSLKHQGKGEVDCTEVRRVKKIKGGLPGAVTFTDQKTALVKL